ncbi:putative disease resistance protein RGA3 [Salvia hispanica]|uniref:putative disease resistance protein RGA3 n=1 Tax=Salvia hispanica TaxID=49212 RepID=UPI002009C0A5|nr:putative disease resistance protein RGA3 [Salvia hispanica]
MVDAIISRVVERIAYIIEDTILHEVTFDRGAMELRDLGEKLHNIRYVLDGAERRGVNDQSVKIWLKKLQNIANEIDDILDECSYSLLKHKSEASDEVEQKVGRSFIPSSWLCFKKVTVRHDIAMQTQNVKVMLDQILKERDDFEFSIFSPDHMQSWKMQSTSFIEQEKVCGFDIYWNMSEIVGKLMLYSDHTQILSIVGMVGTGKTTLAQLIYNNTHIKNDMFDLRIWVCVSHPFDVVGVARNIVESVGRDIIPRDTNQLEILDKVRDCISGRKFFLVLDDVWTEDEDEWRPLKIILQYGALGSTILVTTRNKRVAKMMGTYDDDIYHPRELGDEACWSILRDISLSRKSERECREFEVVGMKIARKCKGLPLAAVVLGRLLQFKDVEGWKDVEKSEIWQLEHAQIDLFPHFVLSYNELSPTLKHCFSYCAIYPKNYQYHAESLIEEWMALGYLDSVGGNSEMELKGQDFLNNLAMHSLFQDIKKSESGRKIEWFKMHDILHDFALFLRENIEVAEMRNRSCQVCDPLLVSQVQENHSLFWEKRIPFHVCGCVTSVRMLRIENGLPPVGMERLIHLRWLDFSGTALSKDDLKILCRFYLLQTLSLARCNIIEVSQEIGNLVHLTRLDLSGNENLKELPESMYSLVELRTLSLAWCSLKEIRGEIENLVELRRLDLSWNTELEELPESIISLVELHSLNTEGTKVQHRLPEAVCQLSNLLTLELRELKVGSHYNKLGLLKKVKRSTGSLTLDISFSTMSDMLELVKDAQEARLKILFQELEKLKISFESTMDGNEPSSSSSPSPSSMWMKLLEALEPHHKLKQLTIWRYEGSTLPSWMSSPNNFIKEISLHYLSEVSSLPALGKLPFLEVLYIDHMEELKLVRREFLGTKSASDDDVVAFPKLKELTFDTCPKWEEWEDITEEEEESADISIMPCLTVLSINFCKSLKKLPHRLLHKVSSSLKVLDIEESSELVATYGEDKEGSPWRSISQHNPQLELNL